MPDKKLTDSEIIKAFKICNNLDDGYCSNCPYEHCDRCIRKVATDTLDLINRLQAENEQWRKNCDDLYKEMSERLKAELKIERKLAKAEAYKEVEEKLSRTTWYRINQKGELVVGANSETDIPLYKAEDVYNLLKELVGEDK